MNSIFNLINKDVTPLIVFTSFCLCTFSFSANAGPLENLERERALVIGNILDPELSPGERQQKIENSKVRLIDLERMVLRDKKLKGKNTPTVRRAFRNYDLTFMLHASTEKNLSIIDNWLAQIGITTQGVMSATIKRQSGE